jgi:hypothetical protein
MGPQNFIASKLLPLLCKPFLTSNISPTSINEMAKTNYI